MKQNSLKQISNCPICRSEEQEEFLTTIDFSTSKEEFNIVQCGSCGFLFTNPRPEESAIGKYYESPTYISHTNSNKGLFGKTYQYLRSKAIKNKLGWIERHVQAGRLLDYGSGTGEFLEYAKAKGWNVQGVEVSDEARERAISSYGLSIYKPEELNSIQEASLDVVSMWHVLEHLNDLQGSLKRILSKLKQGGLLVLALPNPESKDALMYGKFWAAWDVPIHYYHFKKSDISRLAEAHNLELIQVINMPFDAYYVSLLSEEYKRGRKNWIKAAWNGLQSNVAGKNQNASSLTYILKKS